MLLNLHGPETLHLPLRWWRFRVIVAGVWVRFGDSQGKEREREQFESVLCGFFILDWRE